MSIDNRADNSHSVPTATRAVASHRTIPAERVLAAMPFFLRCFHHQAVLAALRADIIEVHVNLSMLFRVEIHLGLHLSFDSC